MLHVVLGVFVLAWLVGPYALRSTVPIWLPFLIALGLELHFLLGGFRPARARRPDRGPQAVDRERYGYGVETDDLLLVGERGEELWIPYSGKTGDDVAALIAAARERRGSNESSFTAEPPSTWTDLAERMPALSGHVPRPIRPRVPTLSRCSPHASCSRSHSCRSSSSSGPRRPW